MTALGYLVLLAVIGGIVCPPVTTPKPKQAGKPEDSEDVQFGLEYERYLKEIVNVLETDEQFRRKLEQANVSDIKLKSAYRRYLREVMSVLVTDPRMQQRMVNVTNLYREVKTDTVENSRE